MQKAVNIYYNLGYWFMLLIVLVFGGFYHTYFSVISQPTPSIIHIHFTLMALWIIMLIAQPFLIKYKKLAMHRLLGKISYVLVPLIFISIFLMVRYSYYDIIHDANQNAAKVLQQAASHQAIALIDFAWFILFYILAIYNKRKARIHARYMLATAFTLLGPTLDRTTFFVFKITKLPGGIPNYYLTFFITDALLLFLLIKDYKRKQSVKTLSIILLIYLSGQLFYSIVPGSDWWTHFVGFIMKPAL
jgi:hypothetical protein